MVAYTLNYNDTSAELVTDLQFSTEVIFNEKVTLFGTTSFADGRSFSFKVFVNDSLQAAKSAVSGSAIVAVGLNNQMFNIGNNTIKVEFYDESNNIIVTLSKTIMKSYYDYFIMIDGSLQPKNSRLTPVDTTTKIYFGMTQENTNQSLEALSITIESYNTGTIKIQPVLKPWDVTGKDMPEVSEYSQNYSLSAGKNTLNLINLLASGKPIYGLVITPQNSFSLYVGFEKSQQTYYRMYLQRPRVTYHDHVVLSWSNVKLRQEAKDNFTKFVLFRDGTKIFETADFNVREYEDTAVTLGATHMYQLYMYVTVPPSVVWDYITAVRDMYKLSGGDKSIIEFNSDNVALKKKSATVSADLSIAIRDTNVGYLEGTGIYLENAQGTNLFKEFFTLSVLDFTDRVGISRLLMNCNMDTSLITLVDDATFIKDLTASNGSAYKMYRFKMRKRTRSITFDY